MLWWLKIMKKPENPVGIKCLCTSFKFKWPTKKLCKNASTNLKGFNDDKSSVPSGSPPPPPSLLDSLELEPFVPQNLKESKNLGGGEKRLKLPPKSKVLSEMSLSVPYHPYTVCLVCGISHKPLQRCSRCKTATYCSSQCQAFDWTVHLRECQYLKDENDLARALSEVNQDYHGASDARSLRQILIKNGKPPVMFVLNELQSLLKSSLGYWDPSNPANKMAVGRIESLVNLAEEECRSGLKINWIRLSSNLFGTVMIHRVINEQASEGYKFGQNAWFESYLYNFGEICDRIKMYAILQENGYDHFLPDNEFPLLPMKEPITVQGQPHFPLTRLKIEAESNQHCMMCKKSLDQGQIISAHDPDRSSERNMARQVNYLPPRPATPASSQFVTADNLNQTEHCLKSWLHVVARIKTFPKEYVCSEECEQHAVYGSVFNSHPLEAKRDSAKLCDEEL